MIEQLTNDQTLMLLKKGMDATSLRHKLIAHNIANVETPGFKASDTNFKDQLNKLLGEEENLRIANTRGKHISSAPPIQLSELFPQIIKTKGSSRVEDGNNVDIDAQMTNLSENTLEFRAYHRAMGDMLSIITSAVRGE